MQDPNSVIEAIPEKEKFDLRPYLLWGLMVLFLLLPRIYQGQAKQVDHINEGYSYLLVSHHLATFNALFAQSANRGIAGQDLRALQNLPPQFPDPLRQITHDTSTDVHPPLYYYFLHFILRFTGPEYNKWQGYGLNFGFHILSLWLLWNIAFLMLKNRFWAMLPCLIWSLSLIAIGLSLFVRMYELLTVWMLMNTWCLLIIFQREETEKKYFFCLFFANLLGFLTHYYTLVFDLALVLGSLVYLRSHFRKYLGVCLSLGTSLGGAFLVFPATWGHLLRSDRAVEMQGVSTQWSSFIRIFKKFDGPLANYFFTAELLIICGSAVVLTIAWGIWRKIHLGQTPSVETLKPWVLLAVSCLVFFVLVAHFSPHRNLRYLAPLFPLLALFLSWPFPFLPRWLAGLGLTIILLASGYRAFTGEAYYTYPKLPPILTNHSKPVYVWLKEPKHVWNIATLAQPGQTYYFSSEPPTHLNCEQGCYLIIRKKSQLRSLLALSYRKPQSQVKLPEVLIYEF